MTVAAALADLPTPCLILDEARMLRNIARLKAHLDGLGVALRPHLKTLKSVEAARRVLKDGNGPATVSTLKEAEVFAAAGVRDIIYAVGIAPQKLPRVIALRGAAAISPWCWIRACRLRRSPPCRGPWETPFRR